MSLRMACGSLIVFLVAAALVDAVPIGLSYAQVRAEAPVLQVSAAVRTPIALTVEDLKKMPRKTVSGVNPHDKKSENYEGVLVEEVLKKAGVPQGEDLKGQLLATYLIFRSSRRL